MSVKNERFVNARGVQFTHVVVPSSNCRTAGFPSYTHDHSFVCH
jgi:hypothetical protein